MDTRFSFPDNTSSLGVEGVPKGKRRIEAFRAPNKIFSKARATASMSREPESRLS
jgi:hypothetical protein